MTAKLTPNLILSYGYDVGENGWNEGVDANFKRLSATSYIYVESATTTTPPAIIDGARYVVPVGATGAWTSQVGNIARAIEGDWEYHTPRAGWEVRVKDDSNRKYWFNATTGLFQLDTVDTSTLVDKTSAQTISGAKTFTGTTVVPTSSVGSNAVNNTRLSNAISGITPVNVGGGVGLFKDKTGVSPNFKSLIAGTNMSFTIGADSVTINGTGGGGGAFDPTTVYDFTNGMTINGVNYGQDYTPPDSFTVYDATHDYTVVSSDTRIAARNTRYQHLITSGTIVDYVDRIDVDTGEAGVGDTYFGISLLRHNDAESLTTTNRLRKTSGGHELSTVVELISGNYTNSAELIIESKASDIGASYSIKGKKSTGSEKNYIEIDAELEYIKMSTLPTYSSDINAGFGGVPQNGIYKTATGELRIKL